jgi:hypothetical protein
MEFVLTYDPHVDLEGSMNMYLKETEWLAEFDASS